MMPCLIVILPLSVVGAALDLAFFRWLQTLYNKLGVTWAKRLCLGFMVLRCASSLSPSSYMDSEFEVVVSYVIALECE